MDTKLCEGCGKFLTVDHFSFSRPGQYWSKCRKCYRPLRVLDGRKNAEKHLAPLREAAAAAGVAGYAYTYEYQNGTGGANKQTVFNKLKRPQKLHKVLSEKKETPNDCDKTPNVALSGARDGHDGA